MHAELEVLEGPSRGARFVVRVGQRLLVGRAGAAVLLAGDPSVSRKHAQFDLRPTGGLYLVDLNSRNGTFLGDRRLEPYAPVRVPDGSRIRIGGHVLRVELRSAPHEDTARLERPTGLGVLEKAGLRPLGVLGEGAHGIVYAAFHPVLDRRLAVKILRLDDPAQSQRLRREARLACRVHSPFVVEVHEVREGDDVLLLLMELVDGDSLRDRLQGGRRLGLPLALAVGEHVARGLSAVHQEGIVHRDVKPSNILIDPSGVAKLGDFGIAKDLRTRDEELTPGDIGLGSIPYVAPEQITAGKTLDERADLYGLGATLYHAIAGHPPFAPDAPDVIRRIAEEEPPPLGSLLPQAPPQVASLVESMLAKAPERRPPSADDVARRLADLRQLFFPEVPTPERSRAAADLTRTERLPALPKPSPRDGPHGRGDSAPSARAPEGTPRDSAPSDPGEGEAQDPPAGNLPPTD